MTAPSAHNLNVPVKPFEEMNGIYRVESDGALILVNVPNLVHVVGKVIDTSSFTNKMESTFPIFRK